MDHEINSEPLSPLGRTEKVMNITQMGLFILALGYTVYFVRPILLPLILALLLTLLLTPIHLFLRRRARLPSPLSAFLVVASFFALLGTGLYHLSAPAEAYSKKLQQEIVQNRLRSVFAPIAKLNTDLEEVARKVEEIADRSRQEEETRLPESSPGVGEANDSSRSPGNQKSHGLSESPPTSTSPPVAVKIQESPVDVAYSLAQNFAFHLALTLTMSFFFLAFGSEMVRPFTENEVAKSVTENIYDDVSRYLLTITLINLSLGMTVAVAMWILGMPNPLLWGALAALLNFIPYIGALMGTGIVFMAAAITFTAPAGMIAAPFVYYALTVIEGNFVTPAIIGGRFSINLAVVFLWIVAWGSLWGIPGMLIGPPLLMVFRIIVTSLPSLAAIDRVISTSK